MPKEEDIKCIILNVQYQTPNAPAEVKTPPTQQNQNQDNG